MSQNLGWTLRTRFIRVMVNFVCLQKPQGAQIFGQTWFCTFFWRCFWMRLTFKFIDWVKYIAPPNMSRPHLINRRPEENKSWPPLDYVRILLPFTLWHGISALLGTVATCWPWESNWDISSENFELARPNCLSQLYIYT